MEVVSRGIVVGELTEAVPDMWYLSGRFIVAVSKEGSRFYSAATALDLRTAYSDPARALRVSLRETMDDTSTLFIVMSLADGELFGRRVFDHDAVEWVLKNVPE